MKIIRKQVVLFLVCLLISGQVVSFAQAQVLKPGEPDPAGGETTQTLYLPKVVRSQPASSIFGVEMFNELANSYVGGAPDLMAKAGATWVRRNGLLWSNVEPSPGVRNWDSALEAELINAQKFGLRPILVIRSTPAWAQKFSGKLCGPIKQDALDEFANFMRDAVARYSGYPYYVKYFELWNEPDVEAKYINGDSVFGCWGDESDAYYGGGYYAQMLKSVYPKIKEANPNAQVLVGGLLLDCDPRNPPPSSTDGCLPSKFLEGIMRYNNNTGGAYFDGVSYHAYDLFPKPPNENDPNSGLGNYQNSNWSSYWNNYGPGLIIKAEYLRQVLNKYGYGWKYLVASEVSVKCGSDAVETFCETVYPQSLSFQNTKAYFAVQSNAAASYMGIRANIWYSYYGWRDSGLMNGYTGELEVAYNAYSFTRQEINWAYSASQLSPAAGVKGYEFVRSDKRVWVLWYVGGEANDGAASITLTLSSTPKAIWKWINVGSNTANDGTYQPAALSQPDPKVVTIGRGPVFIEFTP